MGAQLRVQDHWGAQRCIMGSLDRSYAVALKQIGQLLGDCHIEKWACTAVLT